MDQSTFSPLSLQNTASPKEQKIPLLKSFKLSKRVLILIGVLFIVLVSIILYLVAITKVTDPKSSSQTINTQPVISPTETTIVAKTTLTETKTIDTLNPFALIKVAFVRDGSIYLYEDGKEKNIAKPALKATREACYNLSYPFLSPNGRYLAYIEQIGEQPGYYGCLSGFLRIVDISTGVNTPTNYKTNWFSWTPLNQLEFTPEIKNTGLGQQWITKHIFYDPANNKEKIYQDIIDIATNGIETLLTTDYPSLGDNIIKFKDNKYYLASKTTNNETLLFDKNSVNKFLDWSPSGRYAIFESVRKPTETFDAYELVVDTENITTPPKEIIVGRGGAGGDFSTGRKWYFEKGFVVYCRQELYFVDGSEPLKLTNSDGGGCHNEEGFVATSPNSEYAFVKFSDRFELHTRNGDKTVIKETQKQTKGRSAPKNLIWLSDDYMIIFGNATGGYAFADEIPKVYLFDRKNNVVKPLIKNAYLLESLPW